MSISQNFPNTRPSLSINFARSQTLDPRITFTRTTSGTRVGPDGYIEVIPADQPRFDFDPVTGECLGLLIEEIRTNFALRSQEFNLSPNVAVNASISPNAAIAPDGTLTADKLVEDNISSSFKRVLQGGFTVSGDYTVSFFVKEAGRYRGYIQLLNTTNASVSFNLQNGTASGIIPSRTKIEPYPNGWYRVSTSNTFNSGETPTVYIVMLNDTGNPTYIGDGSSGLYIWGLQVEAGAFPTSYIPTSGSTSTRTADNASITGSNFTEWYNPSEGTIYTQFRCDNWNASNSFGKVFTINEGIFGVENNGFWIGNDANTSNSVRYRVRESGTNQFGPANLIRNSNIVKSALSVKTSDFAVTIDGNAPTTSTSGTLSTSMTNMTIGRDIVGIDNQFLNGTISQLTYYPTRLSNQVLQNLTK